MVKEHMSGAAKRAAKKKRLEQVQHSAGHPRVPPLAPPSNRPPDVKHVPTPQTPQSPPALPVPSLPLPPAEDLPSSNEHPRRSLLGLPAELRNGIYRLVLGRKFVRINKGNHEEPALLRTCSRIRQEALDIFRTERTFCFRVVDMTPLAPKSYKQHWMYRVRTLEHHVSGKASWTNFKAWLKDYYHGEMLRADYGASGKEFEKEPQCIAMYEAFNMAETLRDIDVPWEKAEVVFEAFKTAVSGQTSDSDAWTRV